MSANVAVSVLKNEWRRRIGWIAGLALTIALGGGVAIGALIVAHRTDTAYLNYVERADVGELTINPSISSRAMDTAIRTLPGVESVHSNSLLFASIGKSDGAPFGELLSGDSDPDLQIRGSVDGEFVDVDRPIVSSGRLPTGDHEMFVSDEYRDRLSAFVGHPVQVGEIVPVSFWWSGLDTDENDTPPDEFVSPIGVEPLRIAGFGRLSDEILPEELYTRHRLIVSADVTKQYGCLLDIEPNLTEEESTLTALTPKDCSTNFVYYTLQLANSSSDLTSVRASFDSLVQRLNAELPPAIQGRFGYEYIAQSRTDLDAAVRQTTRPTVAALTVFGIVAAIATLAVVALLIARNLRRDERDHLSLLAIGATRMQRALVAAAAPVVGAVTGLAGATLVAALISPIGPLGSVRDVDPSPGISLPAAMLVLTLGIAASALLVTIAAITIDGARRMSTTQQPNARSLWRARLLDHGNRPSVTTGARATVGSNASWANAGVLIGCVIAIAAVMAATIFGSNLSTLVTQPQRYGWPWDAAVITSYGYGMTDTEAANAALDADSAVESHAFYGLDTSIQVDGHPIPAIYGLSPDDQLDFPILEGRMPSLAGEAVIGASTADKFGISIGDRLPVETPFFEPFSVDIVGTAVLPSLGPFVSDRTGLGRGIYILPAAAPTEYNPYPATFTGISLRDGPGADDFLQNLAQLGPRWDLSAYTRTYTAPVRPPEIVNVSDMRTAPLVLGGVLAVALVAGLALSTAVSVRERRRELAILRTLGFSGRALYISVWWQVLSMITIGLIGGIPLGVIAGRFAWRTFADQLGVVPRADVSAGLIIAIIAGALILGLLAAVLPARGAAHVAPAEVLHSAA